MPLLPEVGHVDDARYAVVGEVKVAVVVAIDERYDRVGAYGVGQLIPVVDVGGLHGHVGDEEYGLGVSALAVAAEDGSDVVNVLRCHVAHGHAHHGTSGNTDEAYAFVLEGEALIAEDLEEVHATALAPVLVMVALDDVPGFVELAEQVVSHAQGCSVASVGDVAGHEHEIGAVVAVDGSHGLPQVVRRSLRMHVDVNVGDDGKAERLKGPSSEREAKTEQTEHPSSAGLPYGCELLILLHC